ncbi:hypothetical protein AVEN_47732-1 [Araneus ventricosus]|uniref:Uncharacterized protein n=1 Tax=Araneus ventricosus TaxID=182803 RepID=A0A4Y2W3E9_ARAVE|nr:hypothetical protein AVEN_47732-1 [Araneus ventricosus]
MNETAVQLSPHQRHAPPRNGRLRHAQRHGYAHATGNVANEQATLITHSEESRNTTYLYYLSTVAGDLRTPEDTVACSILRRGAVATTIQREVRAKHAAKPYALLVWQPLPKRRGAPPLATMPPPKVITVPSQLWKHQDNETSQQRQEMFSSTDGGQVT